MPVGLAAFKRLLAVVQIGRTAVPMRKATLIQTVEAYLPACGVRWWDRDQSCPPVVAGAQPDCEQHGQDCQARHRQPHKQGHSQHNLQD